MVEERRFIPHQNQWKDEDCPYHFVKTVTGDFWKCVHCNLLIKAEKNG